MREYPPDGGKLKDTIGIRVALGFLMYTGLAGAVHHAEALEPQLPEGTGRFLVLEACVQCHDLAPITTQRKTTAGWRRSVNEMVWRGAQLMGDEAEVLTRYLTGSFGPGEPVPQSSQDERTAADVETMQLPPGEGRALVLAACVQCHDLEPIVTGRRTAADWRRSIAQMIQLGVRLMGDEVEVLTQYLTDSFGPDTPVPSQD